MPLLKNSRQEKFAQGLAVGKSADEAYKKAGFLPNRGNAARLKANECIRKRVAELQARTADKAAVTVLTLTEELEQARSMAIIEKQTSAAVAATMGKAKLHGLGVENRRLSGTVSVVTMTAEDLRGLTKDELALLRAALPVLQKVGIVDCDPAGDEGTGG